MTPARMRCVEVDRGDHYLPALCVFHGWSRLENGSAMAIIEWDDGRLEYFDIHGVDRGVRFRFLDPPESQG